MAIIDTDKNVVVLRIVYDGLPFSGKTTTIQSLGNILGKATQVFSPKETMGRTLYFDWMEYVGGFFRGYSISCQLVSVPAQLPLRERRHLLLDSADVVVFVLDASSPELDEAMLRFQEMATLLQDSEKNIPFMIQANKQDVEGALSASELSELFTELFPSLMIVESSATLGKGVRESFVVAVRLAVERAGKLMESGKMQYGKPEIDSGEALLRSLDADGETEKLSHAEIEALRVSGVFSEIHLLQPAESPSLLDNSETLTDFPSDTNDEILPELDDQLIDELADLPSYLDENLSEDLPAVLDEELADLPSDDEMLPVEFDEELSEDLPADLDDELADLPSDDEMLPVEFDEELSEDLPADLDDEMLPVELDEELSEDLPADLDEELADLPSDSDDEMLPELDEFDHFDETPEEALLTQNTSELVQKLSQLSGELISDENDDLDNADYPESLDLESDLLEETEFTEEPLAKELSHLTQELSEISSELQQLEQIVTIPEKTPEKTYKRLPTFPDETTCYQWIWPPISGREVLQQLNQHPLRPQLIDSDTWHLNSPEWQCFSRSHWLFNELEQARHILRMQSAIHLQFIDLLSDKHYLAIAEQRDGQYRLWQIIHTKRTLADDLKQALSLPNPEYLIQELFRCAVHYLDGCQRCNQYLDQALPSLSELAVDEYTYRVVYLGALDSLDCRQNKSHSTSLPSSALRHALQAALSDPLIDVLNKNNFSVEQLLDTLENMHAFDDELLVQETLADILISAA
jgi:signal recognition particle receptor subunit beta